MTGQDLNSILNALAGLRIGVIGDFCLDAYWGMDLSASEISVETGLPTRTVRSQKYTLGGAGTIVNNLVALGVRRVHVFAVLGDDPFGRTMQSLLSEQRADLSGVVIQTGAWDTPAYIKPIREDAEEQRIDFGGFNSLTDETARTLLERLEGSLGDLDAVIVNQQLLKGIHAPVLRSGLNAILERRPDTLFVVDSRHYSDAYAHCVHKLNDVEAARLCGANREPGDVVTREEADGVARQLWERWRRPVFVTRGARGCLVVDGSGLHAVPGLHIVNRTDSVGAGDSLLAGLTVALAAGRSPLEAATLGNLVAGVTVQKLFQTGTASPDEVRAIGLSPDYVYNPELADDPRRAVRVEDSEIEVADPLPGALCISHAIFDHDGTISTLREGWEDVMAPMMIKAILGERFDSADETIYARAAARVADFIDKTTGVQTLAQMKGLIGLVREFGCVPESDILNEFGYKRIYNEALMARVCERMAKLQRSELDVADCTIKGAAEALRRLCRAGVKLYLASGTDQEDVENEAKALGYADLFEGRIYGALADVAHEAKRIVLDRILKDIGEGGVHRLITFGDGPVEIRETRKRGGVAVGVASDEVRRFGWNAAKRARLIRAGAHLVVPDWSQFEKLVRLLGIRGAN